MPIIAGFPYARRTTEIARRRSVAGLVVVRRFPARNQIGNPEDGRLSAGRGGPLGTIDSRSGMDVVAVVAVASGTKRSRESRALYIYTVYT